LSIFSSCPARYVVNTTLAPAVGCPLDPEAAHKAEKVLDASLSKIESIWLEGSVKFLLGSNQPSVADLSLVCEIMQLEVRNLNPGLNFTLYFSVKPFLLLLLYHVPHY